VTRNDSISVVGSLSDLPDLVARIGNGPAILIIGDVVSHSLPWKEARLKEFSKYLVAVQ
jgi:uroporphyrin-III C-methyltransferase/precorrin-2 dehydrogenase/sirohydrochlorin ferrochelatase